MFLAFLGLSSCLEPKLRDRDAGWVRVRDSGLLCVYLLCTIHRVSMCFIIHSALIKCYFVLEPRARVNEPETQNERKNKSNGRCNMETMHIIMQREMKRKNKIHRLNITCVNSQTIIHSPSPRLHCDANQFNQKYKNCKQKS